VNPGDVCVDAGANTGHYTFFCASLVGPKGRVFAFEPNPEFASLVRRSVALNRFEAVVDLRELALWSSTEPSKRFYLSIEPTNTGTSSLVEHGGFLSRDSTIDVPTIRFDDFVEECRIDRFRLVKLDVERAEDAVIEGASRTLAEQRIDQLIVEMYHGGRAQELLLAAGYDGYLIEPERRELLPLSLVEHDRFGDYLFFRPGLDGARLARSLSASAR
jgi:FkbM family methyltransferase